MKYTKYILFAVLIITMLTITACNQETTNNNETNNNTNSEVGETDEHGCNIDEGYTWCPSSQECVQVWQTMCPEYEEYYQEPKMCTKEYAPVTGEMTVPTQQGEKTITLKFGNTCEAEAAGAQNIQPYNEDKDNNKNETTITNFEECVDAGNPIQESHPRQCTHNGETYTENISFEDMNLSENKYEACEELEGTPLEEYNECEHISQDACEYLNGEFHECESACRNDPNAEICTMECVSVCKFN